MDAIKIPFILSVLFLGVFPSCKTKTNYNHAAYNDIMDNSVRLLAKEEKGKIYSAKVMVFNDTLNNDFKSMIDSVNYAKDLQIKNSNK